MKQHLYAVLFFSVGGTFKHYFLFFTLLTLYIRILSVTGHYSRTDVVYVFVIDVRITDIVFIYLDGLP